MLESFDKRRAVSDVWREGLAKLLVNLTSLLVEERAPCGRAFSDEKTLIFAGR